MLYRLYDNLDVLISEAQRVEDAVESFGGEYDNYFETYGEVADKMKVKIFIDKKSGLTKFEEYPIRTFLNKEPVEVKKVSKKDSIKLKGTGESYPGEFKNDDFMEFRERAKNFDEAEQKEALLYMPTGFLLGELARRLEEYDMATAGIAGIIDNMKIYHKE